MSRPKKIQPYNIPENILATLEEHTHGGYFLFCQDDQGNFRVYSNFENETYFKAIKSDAVKWFNAVDGLENQQMLMTLLPPQK